MTNPHIRVSRMGQVAESSSNNCYFEFRCMLEVLKNTTHNSSFYNIYLLSPYRYRWLFYINPNYYGFSSTSYLLLTNFDSHCAGTELECYISSGEYTLAQFNFEETNPALHIMVCIYCVSVCTYERVCMYCTGLKFRGINFRGLIQTKFRGYLFSWGVLFVAKRI